MESMHAQDGKLNKKWKCCTYGFKSPLLSSASPYALSLFLSLSSAQPQASEGPLKHENRKMKTIHKPPKERQRGWGQKQGQNAVEK